MSFAAAAQRLLESRLPDSTRRLSPAERRTETVVAGGVLAAALAFALAGGAAHPADGTQAGALIVAFAFLARVLVQIGAGFTVPTQLVFVPLLLLLPAALVPLAVTAGMVLSVLPELVARRVHAERLLSAVADGWYAVGPALVLALTGWSGGPEWSHWPVYLLVLGLQLAGDLGGSIVREWFGSRLPPGLQARVNLQISLFDVLLAPAGLLAAFASVGHPYAFLLVLPLGVGLALFARERARRIDRALELVEELRAERARTQRAQRRIGETVAATLDRDALRRIVVETAVELVDADAGRLTGGGAPAEYATAGALPAAGQAMAAADAALADRPGLVEARVDGVIALGHEVAGERLVIARTGTAFPPGERELLRGLAGQAAASFRNLEHHERIERQAVTDGLTGLLNHRRLQEVLAQEVRRARRSGTALALVMLDIDHFKAVNDTHGHQQGDRVLREIAAAVRAGVREGDHPARYGGEELAIALPRTGLASARELAERLRATIAGLEIPVAGGASMRVSASFGVAALAAGAGREDLVAACDAALYEAKRAGRDRVAVAGRRVGAG